MAISTYAGLVTAVGNWLNRGTTLDAMIPDFIALAEARFNRDIRAPDMEATATATATETVALPSDFLAARHLYLDVDPRVEIEPVSLSVRNSMFDSASTGYPQQYAISDGQMLLSPAPSDDLTLTLHYWQALPALTASNTTNWLLTSHPDVYLFGTLVEAEAYLWNDERVAGWESRLGQAMASLHTHGVKKRHGGGSLYPRPLVRLGRDTL
jgi:hypothetical protein